MNNPFIPYGPPPNPSEGWALMQSVYNPLLHAAFEVWRREKGERVCEVCGGRGQVPNMEHHYRVAKLGVRDWSLN
jgi:hypothetical protein